MNPTSPSPCCALPQIKVTYPAIAPPARSSATRFSRSPSDAIAEWPIFSSSDLPVSAASLGSPYR